MIEVNPSRFKMKPYAHQLQGVKTLLAKPIYALFWKMRLGKTKAVIDTACLLFEAGEIDTVLVVAPKQVTDVWLDKTLGEIVTHNWSKARAYAYKAIGSLFLPDGAPCFVVASVEFLRQEGPYGGFSIVDDLLAYLRGRRVWFVFDEASVLGNWATANTKSMIQLREGGKHGPNWDNPIKRVTLLDGTPRGNSHMSFYSKFKVLDPDILGCRSYFHYRGRYAKLGGWKQKEVVGEKNMDDFAKRTAPHCEFIEQYVLDMPKKVLGILTAALDEKSWRIYCQMRDELVAELDSGVCAVSHAAVKCMRLAQICAGFLGGVSGDPKGHLWGLEQVGINRIMDCSSPSTVEIHDAPTKMLMGWLKLKLEEDPNFKAVVWSRFVPEIERLDAAIAKAGINHGVKYGKSDGYENELHPRHEWPGDYILVCQPQTAQYGNNFSCARTSIFMSQDYNRVTRAQAGDRVQADGAGSTTLELDVLVTGPHGQKTIVHDIVASVRDKEEAEKRTAQAWKKVLLEE